MNTIYPPSCTAASTALGYVLQALCANGTYDHQGLPGLPDGICVAERDAVLVTTPTPSPLFRRAAERLAAERRLDVALLRVGDLTGDAVSVTVDLTLAALPHAFWPMPDLTLWTGPAGHVWLVPATLDASVAVTDEGFLLDIVPPYASLAERAIGVARAAREIGRRLQTVEA